MLFLALQIEFSKHESNFQNVFFFNFYKTFFFKFSFHLFLSLQYKEKFNWNCHIFKFIKAVNIGSFNFFSASWARYWKKYVERRTSTCTPDVLWICESANLGEIFLEKIT